MTQSAPLPTPVTEKPEGRSGVLSDMRSWFSLAALCGSWQATQVTGSPFAVVTSASGLAAVPTRPPMLPAAIWPTYIT